MASAKKESASAIAGRVRQRFEHDGKIYLPNDLFEADPETVAAKHEAGLIDSHPDAVSHVSKD